MLVSRKTLALNIRTCTRCIGGTEAKRGMVMACKVDGAQVVERATTGEGCPLKLLQKDVPGAVSGPVQIGGTWGPEMWKWMHTAKDWDEARLMFWSGQLPCGDCKRGWLEILKAMPPVYGDGWFEWSVAAHNAVNAKLGKPEVGFAEARARWVQ